MSSDRLPTDPPTPPRGLSRTLAHPAFLLVLTALLTGILVPWFTSRWEARDKRVEAHRAATERELEVKSAIVGHIGTASAKFLSAMEVHVIDANGSDASAEYRAFKTDALEIASQLAAYFPASRPVVRWRDYTYSLRNAFILLTAPVGRPRNIWLDRLDRYIDVKPTQFDGLCFARKAAVFATDLRELALALQNKEQTVVRDVASSQTVLTGTPTRDVNVKRLHYDPTHPRPCDKYFKPKAA